MWSNKNNALFLQIPKTGTTTIRQHFKQAAALRDQYVHTYVHSGLLQFNTHPETYVQLLGKLPFMFNLYTMCRDPIQRYISAANYARNQYKMSYNGVGSSALWQNSQRCFRELLGDDTFDILEMSNDDFIKALIVIYPISNVPITSEQWLAERKKLWKSNSHQHFGMWEFFTPQYGFYVDERFTIFNFHKYDEEFQHICDLLEMPRVKPERLNAASGVDTQGVSADTESILKLFYQQDYEFFMKRGINFDMGTV
jgi:hypothetical protein